MANNPVNVNVDGEVYKLPSLIESFSASLQTFEANAKLALSDENLVNILEKAMENEVFRRGFVNALVSHLTSARIIREVVAESNGAVKEAIYKRVETLLTTDALTPAVSQILKLVSNGNLPELPDIMSTPRLEDVKPDSTENVHMICKILAGDKAWA